MAGENDISREQLKKAFEILFGPQFTFSEAVLNYLQPSGIKSAYREQVKIHHPDKAENGSSRPGSSNSKFQELTDAYRLLLDYKQQKIRFSESPNRHQAQPRTKKTSGWQKTTAPHTTGEKHDFYYPGDRLPRHKLRLGEFLYYSKIISWNTLIKALVYKRKFSDKKMGQYFIEKKHISENDLQRYLAIQEKHNKTYGKT